MRSCRRGMDTGLSWDVSGGGGVEVQSARFAVKAQILVWG